MTRPQVIHVASLAELRARAAPWDDLWWRSDCTTPALRAEMIALWMEHFAPRARFHALVVEDGGRWAAALPLVGRRVAGIFPAAATVGNAWTSCADLVWDAAEAADAGARVAVGDALVQSMARLPWQLLWLEGAALDAPPWRALREALARAGTTAVCRGRWLVGRVPVAGPWPACQSRWSSKHRRNLARGLERLAARGAVTLDVADRLDPQEVEPRLREALEVEDAGWKGAAGSSVLRTPGVFDFFLRQARQLAAWDQLALAVLRCGGRAVAFSYGMAAKGVFHSWKIGYDARDSDCGPGQLLRYRLLQWLHDQERFDALDFVGPLNDAQAHWHPDTYAVGRLMVAPRRWLERWALRAYERCRRQAQKGAPLPPGEGRGEGGLPADLPSERGNSRGAPSP
jgi:CelD/BcsL family acetyltransferase involved in cellulose biosynthesis